MNRAQLHPRMVTGGSVQGRGDDDPTKTPGVTAGAAGQGGLSSAPRLRDNGDVHGLMVVNGYLEVLPEKWRVKFHLKHGIFSSKFMLCFERWQNLHLCFLGVRIACISCSFGVLGEHGGTMTSCNFTSHGGIAPWVSPSIDPWDEESWICWSFDFFTGMSLGEFVVFLPSLGCHLKQKQGLETRQGHDDAEVELGPLRA